MATTSYFAAMFEVSNISAYIQLNKYYNKRYIMIMPYLLHKRKLNMTDVINLSTGQKT